MAKVRASSPCSHVFLSRHVQAESNNVRIEQSQVERSHEEVKIRQHDSHGAIDDILVAIHISFGLVSIARILTGHSQGRGFIGICAIMLVPHLP